MNDIDVLSDKSVVSVSSFLAFVIASVLRKLMRDFERITIAGKSFSGLIPIYLGD